MDLLVSLLRVTQEGKRPRVVQSMLRDLKVDVLCMLAVKAKLF